MTDPIVNGEARRLDGADTIDPAWVILSYAA